MVKPIIMYDDFLSFISFGVLIVNQPLGGGVF